MDEIIGHAAFDTEIFRTSRAKNIDSFLVYRLNLDFTDLSTARRVFTAVN